MENLKNPLAPALGDSDVLLNEKLRYTRYFNRVKSILVTLRAFIYDHVSSHWVELNREKDRINLLGIDYRLTMDQLDVLKTPAGSELLAAVDNLGSTNPAKWRASALLCRNVIILLAKKLWQGSEKSYIRESGETIDISGEKEKNILLAYMDTFCKKASTDGKYMLKEADNLMHKIYDRGSKGKHSISHKEAQELVIDTFHFVDLLSKATGLLPIDELD